MRLTLPNGSAVYRTARNALLDAAIALRRQLEAGTPSQWGHTPVPVPNSRSAKPIRS